MKNKILSALLLVVSAAVFSGLSAAQADTITGKVAAMTKNSKETSAEIIPDSAGGQPSHRCSVSTTFQEIGEMLMQAMESKATVAIVSSKNCAPAGAVRDCGSIVTIETVPQKRHSQPRG
ncbi:hypothetical protein [Candidatus Electronema sp. JC]|jgi:Na+-translocating ferredoxin:NAD+ oxidoreductase RnfG subunit|uniref:hypothetical protein n=1 Tax=Candidatus Electronema sp. JC TaxID=3401570 RepID=UPI003B4381C0